MSNSSNRQSDINTFLTTIEQQNREWLIHSTRACTPGETIGMRIGPNEIHIMARSEG